MVQTAAQRDTLDLQAIVRESRQATGLNALGKPSIDEGLGILVSALNNEAGLNGAGIAAMRSSLVGLLSNRMRLNEIFNHNPDIFDEEIKGPIIIVGLPRSGTTKFQRMFAATGDFQYLPLWKIMHPSPLEALSSGQPDPRIALTEQICAMMQKEFPAFYAGHPMSALDADEEVFMADLVLRGWNACYSYHTPSFEAWLLKQDFSTWYEYLYKLLQFFQWQDGSSGKPWLLKTCEHIAYLPELFKCFPDATIVHCHRDPVSTIPSIAALAAESRRMYSDQVDQKATAYFLLKHLSDEMQCYLEQRSVLEQRHQFIDIAYSDILHNATDRIEFVYGEAGMTFPIEFHQVLADWEKQNTIGKYGKHNYSLEGLQLSEAEVREAFATYLERFKQFLTG